MYDRELDDIANATESDDSVPHVHKLSEACEWWAEAFPQHKAGEPQ